MIRLQVFVVGTALLSYCLTVGDPSAEDHPPYPGNASSTLISDQIVVNKCCKTDYLYWPSLNSCRKKTNTNAGGTLSLHSAMTDEFMFKTSIQSLFFKSFPNPLFCPDGFISRNSIHFRFYDDGTVKLTTDKRTLKRNEYCIQETPWEELVVRFCASTSCYKGTNCIRKCCPMGEAFNRTSKRCQSDPTPFVDQAMALIRQEEEDGNYKKTCIIAEAAPPDCGGDEGRQLLSTSMFHLLPDGRMNVPSFTCFAERKTRDYCVENIIYHNQTKLEGMRCFTSIYETSQGTKKSLEIYPYFLLVSSFFLFITFGIYVILPEIRDSIHGVSMMIYFASMAIFNVGLALIKLGVGLDNVGSNVFCRPLAVATHFFFLSTFTWLNIVCFDLWWTFKLLEPSVCRKKGFRCGRRFLGYVLYAYGIPLCVVVTGQVFDLSNVTDDDDNLVKPNFGVTCCWFVCRESFVIYLYTPIAASILCNVIFFVRTAVLFYKTSTEAAFAATNGNVKQRFCVLFNLFIVMGVSWTAEVISFAIEGSVYKWFIADITNSMTGVFIFFIFIYKPRIWKLLGQKFPGLKRLIRGGRQHQPSSRRVCRLEWSRLLLQKTFSSESSNSTKILTMNNIPVQLNPLDDNRSHPHESFNMLQISKF